MKRPTVYIIREYLSNLEDIADAAVNLALPVFGIIAMGAVVCLLCGMVWYVFTPGFFENQQEGRCATQTR